MPTVSLSPECRPTSFACFFSAQHSLASSQHGNLGLDFAPHCPLSALALPRERSQMLRNQLSYIPQGPLSLVDSSAFAFAAPRVAAYSSHVRCNADKKLRKVFAGFGVMHSYAPDTSCAERSRVWGTMFVFTQVSRPQPMQTLTQETRETLERKRESTRIAVHSIYIRPVKFPAKCPGKTTAGFKSCIQIKVPFRVRITQYAAGR